MFTDTLDKRFSELGTSTFDAARKIGAIRTESRDARAVLVGIASELRGISKDAGADGDGLDSLRLAHLAEVDRMVEESRALGAQVQSAVGCVTACLQFPDAFAQRIEHVRAILAGVDQTGDSGQRSLLARLAVAHLDDMAEALRESADAGMTALAAIPLPHEDQPAVRGRGERRLSGLLRGRAPRE